ncbi:MAG: glycosyltransferase [Myxococcota bacterium]
MPIVLTERRVPTEAPGVLGVADVTRLVTDVGACLESVDVELVEQPEGVLLRIELEPQASADTMRHAFGVMLATFQVASEGWTVVHGPRLRVDEAGVQQRIDRLGVPLALYADPEATGTVELHDEGVEIALPPAPAPRLGRLAAVLVASLRGRVGRPGPALSDTPKPRVLKWQGGGTQGRNTRVGSDSTVQREALTLLRELEDTASLGLDPADRELLREELTGATMLPLDETPIEPLPIPEPVVTPARRDVPPVSVILASHGEGYRVMLTVEALRAATEIDYEVIVVDDGSSDGCCDFLRAHVDEYPEVTLVTQQRQGSAVARNSGVVHARAQTLVFMDAHCFPHAGWLPALLEVLERPGVGIATSAISVAGDPSTKGYGQTIGGPRLEATWLGRLQEEPFAVPVAGAGCLAMRRATFQAIGGFEPMRRYGHEDIELSIRCWLMGFDVVVDPKADVGHVFKKQTNFEVPWVDFLHNVLRTAVLHFDGEPLRAVLEGASGDPCFGPAMGLLLTGDIWERRAWVRSRAVRDGAWFYERFGLNFRSR